MDVLVVDALNRCFLNCSNCTRLIAHQTETRELDPELLREIMRSLKGWYEPGKVLGLIGGEVTLSKRFAEWCKVFREEWNPGQDCSHGYEPIADFNRYAHERLFDRSNGRGLWTSFGPKWMDVWEDVSRTFSHFNPNSHEAEGAVHQTGLVDAREMMDALGLPWEDFPKYRDRCWVQNTWSAGITQRGTVYFCEYAAQLDLLYNDGKLGLPITEGWWKKQPHEFGEQLSICERCSLALPGPSQVDTLERDIVSESHRIRLEQVGSPAVRKGRIELYDPAKHAEQRSIDRKDNYVAPSGIRVSNSNPYVYGKRTALVVTCVGRAADLARTLPRNAGLVDQVVVVTDARDTETRELVWAMKDLYPHVNFLDADPHVGDAAFNKGALLNAALAAVRSPDWILLSDADVFLNPRLKPFLATHALNPGVLHGVPRYDVGPENRPTLLNALDGQQLPVPILPQPGNGVNAQPNGYFQLFNRRASAIRDRWPNVFPETFCSAGGVDSWLMQQFDRAKVVMVDMPVFHVAHGELGAGWNGEGRTNSTVGPRWRQCGMMTADAYYPVGGPLTYPARFRFTDTRKGESFDVECPEPPVDHGEKLRVETWSDGLRDLVFMGRPLNGAHVHVAVWE